MPEENDPPTEPMAHVSVRIPKALLGQLDGLEPAKVRGTWLTSRTDHVREALRRYVKRSKGGDE